MRITVRLLFVSLLLSCFYIHAQPKTLTSGEIELAIRKLNTVGSVLYIAAHPDDENTNLLAYFANEQLVKTSYLSLTRGDGGQNLIGKEIREELGVIRTQELLAARKIDGADQYFSRANDFGFSKNPEEALRIWGKDKILSDVVWTIRKTRPDIIITRFPTNGDGGHGHHTASAILAEEAFHAAADPKRFPEQLKWVKPWQAKTIYWNAWRIEKGLPIDVGTYNPLLGKSYTEMAAESRTMHKSQGFGVPKSRGSKKEYLSYTAGEKPDSSIFGTTDLTWKRVKGSEEFAHLLNETIKNYNSSNPAASIPLLVKAYQALLKVEDEFWRTEKSKELTNIILACAGVYYESTSSTFQTYPGGNVELTMLILNRSSYPINLKSVVYEQGKAQNVVNKSLQKNEPFTLNTELKVEQNKEFSQKYWLEKPYSEGLYTVQDQLLIGTPDNKAPFISSFELEIDGQTFKVDAPVMYKWTDPVQGERYRTLLVVPPVSAQILNKVNLFPDGSSKNILVTLNSQMKEAKGQVSLEIPQGWKVEPSSQPFELGQNNEEQTFSFTVTPEGKINEGRLRAIVKVGDKTYSKSKITIDYPHIPVQTLLPDATAKAVRLDVSIAGRNIGYIPGAGDEIPSVLRQTGYHVTTVTDQQLSNPSELAKYDAIILGVRAFNTHESLKSGQHNLIEYVEKGGNLIVQYNTNSRLITDNLGPYPIQLSRDRVTVENSPVKILKENHPILNRPNKITEKDFEGWVQERGLYFPNKWDDHYETVIATNDPGEKSLESGILATKYGKGSYIYTSYSWFRELPEGVPGAIRLFTNLISYNKETESASK